MYCEICYWLQVQLASNNRKCLNFFMQLASNSNVLCQHFTNTLTYSKGCFGNTSQVHKHYYEIVVHYNTLKSGLQVPQPELGLRSSPKGIVKHPIFNSIPVKTNIAYAVGRLLFYAKPIKEHFGMTLYRYTITYCLAALHKSFWQSSYLVWITLP